MSKSRAARGLGRGYVGNGNWCRRSPCSCSVVAATSVLLMCPISLRQDMVRLSSNRWVTERNSASSVSAIRRRSATTTMARGLATIHGRSSSSNAVSRIYGCRLHSPVAADEQQPLGSTESAQRQAGDEVAVLPLHDVAGGVTSFSLQRRPPRPRRRGRKRATARSQSPRPRGPSQASLGVAGAVPASLARACFMPFPAPDTQCEFVRVPCTPPRRYPTHRPRSIILTLPGPNTECGCSAWSRGDGGNAPAARSWAELPAGDSRPVSHPPPGSLRLPAELSLRGHRPRD